jgi:hypothetical protein
MPRWLDGNALRAAASESSNAEVSPPKRHTSNRKAPALVSQTRTTKHIAKATPEVQFELQKLSPSLPIEQTKLSAESSRTGNLSPVTRHRISQIRRASLAPKVVSPTSSDSLYRKPATKEVEKRPSVVRNADRHANNLALAPSPVASFPSPGLTQTAFAEDGTSSVTPDTDPPHHISISKPRPGCSAFEPVGGRKISHVIEDLENMVQEAVNIADDTSSRSQVEKIYMIIEDAKNAIQESAIDPARHLMTGASPLHVSESTDTMAPLPKISPTRFGLQREPTSLDWAYQHPGHTERVVTPHSTSNSDNSEEESQSRLSTRSDLLLPPKPTQVAPREQIDFVLRLRTGEELRGRPRRRPDSSPPGHRRKHRLRDRGINNRRKTMSRSRSASRSQGQRSLSISRTEFSIDDEPLPPQRYGRDLHVRDHVHRHMLGLQRDRARQPIARNWSPSKKRLAAIIACINTALLGIMIGVYVSRLLSRVQILVLTLHRQVRSPASSTTWRMRAMSLYWVMLCKYHGGATLHST